MWIRPKNWREDHEGNKVSMKIKTIPAIRSFSDSFVIRHSNFVIKSSCYLHHDNDGPPSPSKRKGPQALNVQACQSIVLTVRARKLPWGRIMVASYTPITSVLPRKARLPPTSPCPLTQLPVEMGRSLPTILRFKELVSTERVGAPAKNRVAQNGHTGSEFVIQFASDAVSSAVPLYRATHPLVVRIRKQRLAQTPDSTPDYDGLPLTEAENSKPSKVFPSDANNLAVPSR